jgi:hypothetical protein
VYQKVIFLLLLGRTHGKQPGQAPPTAPFSSVVLWNRIQTPRHCNQKKANQRPPCPPEPPLSSMRSSRRSMPRWQSMQVSRSMVGAHSFVFAAIHGGARIVVLFAREPCRRSSNSCFLRILWASKSLDTAYKRFMTSWQCLLFPNANEMEEGPKPA